MDIPGIHPNFVGVIVKSLLTMAATTSKSIAIQQSFLDLGLTANEIQFIKDVIINGYWGDSDIEINGAVVLSNGYIINNNQVYGTYKGKQVSGYASSVSRKLDAHQCSFMKHCPDYWEDGSGDLFFFSEDFASHDELMKWAESSTKAERLEREHSERIKVVEGRRNNYVAELQECQDRKRIASLKRKIARAQARLEVLHSIDGLFRTPEEK